MSGCSSALQVQARCGTAPGSRNAATAAVRMGGQGTSEGVTNVMLWRRHKASNQIRATPEKRPIRTHPFPHPPRPEPPSPPPKLKGTTGRVTAIQRAPISRLPGPIERTGPPHWAAAGAACRRMPVGAGNKRTFFGRTTSGSTDDSNVHSPYPCRLPSQTSAKQETRAMAQQAAAVFSLTGADVSLTHNRLSGLRRKLRRGTGPAR
jgi:hypothetical protein